MNAITIYKSEILAVDSLAIFGKTQKSDPTLTLSNFNFAVTTVFV